MMSSSLTEVQRVLRIRHRQSRGTFARATIGISHMYLYLVYHTDNNVGPRALRRSHTVQHKIPVFISDMGPHCVGAHTLPPPFTSILVFVFGQWPFQTLPSCKLLACSLFSSMVASSSNNSNSLHIQLRRSIAARLPMSTLGASATPLAHLTIFRVRASSYEAMTLLELRSRA